MNIETMVIFIWVWYLLINITILYIEPFSSETFLIVIFVWIRRKDGKGYGAIALNLSKMLQYYSDTLVLWPDNR